jgi:hypothetical protein
VMGSSAFFTLGVLQRGYPVASRGVSDAVAICSLLIIVWARLSLGRDRPASDVLAAQR